MMKNSPHDAGQLCLPNPTDQNGRPLTYQELVQVFRTALRMSQGDVTEPELEPLA
jgi:hypothetical protein